MTLFPPIILNKIYWYQWHYLQTNLCIEYHKLFKSEGIYIRYQKSLWPINNRYLSQIKSDHQNFCFINTKQVGILPINYAYSNGSIKISKFD